MDEPIRRHGVGDVGELVDVLLALVVKVHVVREAGVQAEDVAEEETRVALEREVDLADGRVEVAFPEDRGAGTHARRTWAGA